MQREEIEQKLQLAETHFRNEIARLGRLEQMLQELNDRREEILGEEAMASRARADFERLSEQLRDELVALDVEEAREALAEAVQKRDDVITRAASALDSAVSLLETIDAQRAAVLQALEQLRSLDEAAARTAPEEPDILHAPWQRMVSAVKSELDGELVSDIVDAAARSTNPNALKALPVHLRELATQRRRQMQRERNQRHREPVERQQAAEQPSSTE